MEEQREASLKPGNSSVASRTAGSAGGNHLPRIDRTYFHVCIDGGVVPRMQSGCPHCYSREWYRPCARRTPVWRMADRPHPTRPGPELERFLLYTGLLED